VAELIYRSMPSTQSGMFRLLRLILGTTFISIAGCPGPQPTNPAGESPTPIQTPTPISTATPIPTPAPTPTPTPLPESFVPSSKMDTARLFNGFEIHSKVTTLEGDSAVVTRRVPDSYLLDLDVNIRVPKAAQTVGELQLADPTLPSSLPGLENLLTTAKVSNFYHALYQLKIDSLNRNLVRLDQLLSRHNFFDCNTILEITDPSSSRKVLLIQSDMDVNSDGSDADRSTEVDGSSTNFQPFTSYRWPRRTDKPSQFLSEREAKLKELQIEFDAKTTLPERKKVLKEQIAEVEREIGDLRRYSFLISKEDPFIVLPGFMLRQATHPFLPRFGDYVVLVYHGTLYPALLGDAGPSYKIGEASLRIATQIDPKANPYNRPETDLDVTYLVFPGTADPQPGPPDLKALHERCQALLNDIGGYRGELWEWTDLLATASATPAKTSNTTPSPSPNATPEASPSVSSSPQPSVSPLATAKRSPAPAPTATPTARARPREGD
jgi:hypothetical protein